MATDAGRKETDKALEQLEKRITKQYDRAAREVERKLNNYLQSFAQKDREKARLVKKGQLSEREYAQWRQGQIMIGERWKEMRDILARDLTNADKIASNMISGNLPDVYAMGFNYGTFEAESLSMVDTAFTLYDRDTVARLIRDYPELLPKPKVDIPKDMVWNRRHIDNAITQGILQGEDIDSIAKRLRSVTDMDRDASIRNARTMTTSAENAGRTDSYKRAEDMGINMIQVWVASLDSRTREAHRELDGQERPVGEPFKNSIGEIRYPGDPHADPANVYNCRCTLIAKTSRSRISEALASRQDKKIDGQSYAEWKKEHQKAATPQQTNNKTIHQSLVDAYEYHRINNGLSSAEYDPDSKLQFIAEDVELLDEKSRETLKSEMSKLTSKYDTPITNIHTMDKIEALGRTNAFAYVSHDYRTDTATMVINPVKCKDESKLVERIKELRNKKYSAYVPDDDLAKYVYTHEFGHSLINMKEKLEDKYNFVNANYEKIRNIREKVETIYNEYAVLIGELEQQKKDLEMKYIVYGDVKAQKDSLDIIEMIDKNRISKYSLTNSDEFFAESFVYTEFGGKDNQWANRIREIIDENFGR